MNVLVCIKRVPGTGSSVELTADGTVDTRHLAFTIGPHEECAVEEAVRIVGARGGAADVVGGAGRASGGARGGAADVVGGAGRASGGARGGADDVVGGAGRASGRTRGGTVTVLTVGPPEADEQLRYAMSMGAHHAVRVNVGRDPLDPQATAAAIVAGVRELEAFDLVLFGNESADAGHYQVGVRVAHALDLPVVGGVKGIELGDGSAPAERVRMRRAAAGGAEVYEASLPAAASVMEGLNLPRYPSMRGRLRAAKAPIQVIEADVKDGGLRPVRLHKPAEEVRETVVLGKGPEAAPAVADVLEALL